MNWQRRRVQRGFTIIEVVLFLALSGGLVAVLLAGTSLAIQRQQYRDAVQSFAGFLRDEYAQVISVENLRQTDATCPIKGAVSAARGQSNCVIVGRYITTGGNVAANDGTRYQSHPVYALKQGDVWHYAYQEAEATTYELNWGVKTRFSRQSEQAAHIAMVLYRHPETGQLAVRAASGRYTQATIVALIEATDAPGAQRYEICLYERGWLRGQRQSVFLGARAGSSDAITVGEATKECDDAS